MAQEGPENEGAGEILRPPDTFTLHFRHQRSAGITVAYPSSRPPLYGS